MTDNRPMRRQVALFAALVLLTGLVVVVPPAPPAQAATISGAGTVYAGIYSEHFEAGPDLNNLAAATGKRMTFAGTFHSVNENDGLAGGWSNTREALNAVWAGQATPFANLTVPASAASIASGAWDGKINEWASHLQQFLDLGGGRSLVLAPLQEMNGNWTSYGCDPANFISAYQRVVDIIRGRGIDETKVRFAFAPNGWTPPGCGSIGSYYPGNAYVDVIGISAYRWADGANVFSVMGDTVNQVAGAFPGKPIIIAQTGAWPSAEQRPVDQRDVLVGGLQSERGRDRLFQPQQVRRAGRDRLAGLGQSDSQRGVEGRGEGAVDGSTSGHSGIGFSRVSSVSASTRVSRCARPAPTATRPSSRMGQAGSTSGTWRRAGKS